MGDILLLVGSRIKDIRKSMGFSQDQLGEKCGFHYSYIGGVERGERNISLENLAKVANALHVEIGDFFRFDSVNASDEKDLAIEEVLMVLRTQDTRKIQMTKNVLLEIMSAYSE